MKHPPACCCYNTNDVVGLERASRKPGNRPEIVTCLLFPRGHQVLVPAGISLFVELLLPQGALPFCEELTWLPGGPSHRAAGPSFRWGRPPHEDASRYEKLEIPLFSRLTGSLNGWP